MLEIDGSQYSGSGTIVRQSVGFAALTGTAIHIFNVRLRRPKPGLRRQHAQAVEAVRQLVDGTTEGAIVGARDFVFRPGKPTRSPNFIWDIGSAGSTTALALAVLPVLAFGSTSVSIELRGGLFQDFAPSLYHLEHVLLSLLQQMGVKARVRMERPGYVPTGGGIWHLAVTPTRRTLEPLTLDRPGAVGKIWGIALSSQLRPQSVSDRMAESTKRAFEAAGYRADIEVVYDDSALQAGADLAVFADLSGGARIGSDRAGAPGRRSESIGNYAARRLLEDLKTGASLDRYASDQIIPWAALAAGESKFRIPRVSEHIESNAWLSREFLGAEVTIEGHEVTVRGVGFRARAA
ncbi:MAG TPA: RNA 3'-terminal phosphate cyclase [Candidatus Binatia bacterium]|nr:RNA 3'-terminal phosphate cyclase [Candidatus Binatia bacterium]